MRESETDSSRVALHSDGLAKTTDPTSVMGTPIQTSAHAESTGIDEVDKDTEGNHGVFVGLFFVVGLLNNNTFELLAAGSQDLAHTFGKDKLMGTVQL